MGSCFKFIARMLIASMLLLPFHPVYAGIVGTQQVINSAQAQGARDKVLNFVSRADVQRQLETLGTSPEQAKARVASMTDDEVTTVAGKLDTLPAGGNSGWAVAVILIVLAAGILYYVYK
ncbi:hypothetical protein PTE30175_02851 [Pandoraea terrae]|uniref:PA2779 family protein n=1 Tax=Pandoraea terrae TaxID=1537710 RepID=A0A5E4VWS6_9BURK|nr:PA2779 family protein [Pandoraea terrae]VVE17047.1 hypothetical protein PTE30175_02851 [Pandoraea terrae]